MLKTTRVQLLRTSTSHIYSAYLLRTFVR